VRDALADVLHKRLSARGSAPARIPAVSLAGAALASLESAQIEWVSPGNERPLDELLDQAMSAVAPLIRPRR